MGCQKKRGNKLFAPELPDVAESLFRVFIASRWRSGARLLLLLV